MISRRKLLGMLGAGALIAPQLLLPKRSIFLPPVGGWPRNALATMDVPRSDLPLYAEGIAAGRFVYDDATETMSVVQLDPHHHAGKFHSPTGRIYDWTDDEVPQAFHDIWNSHKLPEPTYSKRAAIDDQRDARPPLRSEWREHHRNFLENIDREWHRLTPEQRASVNPEKDETYIAQVVYYGKHYLGLV